MAKLLITILLLLGTAVLGVFYVGPAWQNYRALRQDSENLQTLSAEFDDLIKNRDALIDTINSISKNDLDRIDQSLPQGPQAGGFLVTLDKLASQNRIILKNIDLVAPERTRIGPLGQPNPGLALAPPKAQGTFQEFPVTLTSLGSYEQFKNFLADLEKNVRLIDVQNISFSSPEKNNINFTIKAKTYYQ